MNATGASISNRFNRTAQGLWMVLLGIPLLIAYGAGLILIIIGAVRMRGSGRANKIRKKGQEAFGTISYKIMEHGEEISLLTQKRVIFYYELENGLLGRTNQAINKRTYKILCQLKKNIPIKVLDNQAAIDIDKFEDIKEKEDIEKIQPDTRDLGFSSQDPAYRYKYGEMTKKSVVLLILAGVFFVVYEVFSHVSISVSSGDSQTLAYFHNIIAVVVMTVYLSFFLCLLFFFLGMKKMAFYGIASKIRKDDHHIEKEGRLIPFVNKNGGTLRVLPNKAIFQYTAENGLLIQTEQVINKKMFLKIMEKTDDEVSIFELSNYAVINNKKLLGQKPSKFEKLFEFLNKYKIFFAIAVISNIYFLVTELIHLISVGFTDGVSIFSLAMYFLTIIYITLMEFLEPKDNKGNWAYVMTVVFLSCNVVATIATLVIGFMNVGVSFFHTGIINFFGFGGIYFFYILYKISKSIVNSKKADRLELPYERCSNFGDIISNFYTLFNYIAWVFIVMFLYNTEARPVMLETGIFVTIMLANLIVSIVFIVKCAKGTTKETKMKKDDIKE